MIRHLAAVTLAAALLAAGCGGDDSSDAAASATTAAASATTAVSGAAASGADLELADLSLGSVLVDADGMVLYLFTPDAQGDSTCYDQCEATWPVVGELESVGDGLDAALLGTTTRKNGDVQATYNGWPLYYFGADAAAGDALGQGLKDVWFVVDAEGDAVKGAVPAATSTTKGPGY